MNITFFGTYNTGTTPRIQVLKEGLEDNGVTVNECNQPLPVSTKERVALLSSPWKIPSLMFNISKCWMSLIKKKRHVPKSDYVLIGHLGLFDIHLAKLLYRHQHVVLDYMISAASTAKDRGKNGKLLIKILTLIDNWALKKADTILVDTKEHQEELPAKFKKKSLVISVGAPNEWFVSPKKTHKKAEPLKVIFFGNYIPLQGATVIAQSLALINEEVHLSMVGGGQDKDDAVTIALLQSPSVHVHWFDWVESYELPEIVADHDVCLGIFGDTKKSHKVVPNKMFQGAAAGCALITSSTGPQKQTLGEAAIYVSPGDPKSLASAINDVAKDRAKLQTLKNKSRTLAEEKFRPKTIVLPLIKLLKS
ncbi:MAG: glycosyltransferase [Candidatus Saccharimonadales bacterium]